MTMNDDGDEWRWRRMTMMNDDNDDDDDNDNDDDDDDDDDASPAFLSTITLYSDPNLYIDVIEMNSTIAYK